MSSELSNGFNVFQAINSVQADLARTGIQKSQKNQQQRYNFRGIDDIYNALSSLLAKNGLCIMPNVMEREVVQVSTKSGGTMNHVTLKVRLEFISSKDGSCKSIEVYGEAMDSGDKATNKAMTAAYKVACLQVFCIPTEGDNEADRNTDGMKRAPEKISHDQKQQMQAFLAAKHISEGVMLASWNIKSLNEFWAETFQPAMDWIENQPAVVQNDPAPVTVEVAPTKKPEAHQYAPEEPPVPVQMLASGNHVYSDGSIRNPDGVITCHGPTPSKTPEEAERHRKIAGECNKLRTEQRKAEQKKKADKRQQRKVAATPLNNDHFDQDRKAHPVEQEQKVINRMQYLSGVANDVRNKRMETLEESQKFRLSNQVLSPFQFKSINDYIVQTDKDHEKLRDWICQKCNAEIIGKIDSAYYPKIMAKLRTLVPDEPPVNRNQAGLGDQYDARSAMYERMGSA